MTISYEVRKAVVLLKHSSFFDKICNYSEPCKTAFCECLHSGR